MQQINTWVLPLVWLLVLFMPWIQIRLLRHTYANWVHVLGCISLMEMEILSVFLPALWSVFRYQQITIASRPALLLTLWVKQPAYRFVLLASTRMPLRLWPAWAAVLESGQLWQPFQPPKSSVPLIAQLSLWHSMWVSNVFRPAPHQPSTWAEASVCRLVLSTRPTQMQLRHSIYAFLLVLENII